MAGLTRQHFNEIAEIINKNKIDLSSIKEDELNEIEEENDEVIRQIVNDLSRYFKTQNPLFNENQFKKACLK